MIAAKTLIHYYNNEDYYSTRISKLKADILF